MFIIILFILIFNIVSILLIYRCLLGIEKKERFIFLATGVAIIYMLTSISYWISTQNVEITEVSETGKDMIIFLFVPINGILILPLIAKSYAKYRANNLRKKILTNRCMVLGAFLLILLVIECIYFKNIQDGVVNLIKEQSAYQQEENQNNNMIASNSITQEEVNNNLSNEINAVNEIKQNSLDGNTLINEVANMVE